MYTTIEGEILQDAIHQPLERCSCVTESKAKVVKHERSKACVNSGFWDVIGCHRDLKIPLCYVKLTKDTGVMEEGGDVTDVQQRIVIGFSFSVEAMVISAELKETILFYFDVQGQ